jgi:hypothetical protein
MEDEQRLRQEKLTVSTQELEAKKARVLHPGRVPALPLTRARRRWPS